MVEGLRIEADENGWELVIEGDLYDECERYLTESNTIGEARLRLNIQAAAFDFAGSAGLLDLHEWRAEGLAAKASRPRNDGDGYTLDDPKHPHHYELIAGIWDEREGK